MTVKRVGAATVALAAIGSLTGCQVQITPDGAPYAVVSASTGALSVANESSGPNERELLWASSQPSETSSTECATWVAGVGLAQNGLAFRINSEPQGPSSAVVLERNVWDLGFWDFIVIYFHNGDGTGPFDVGPGVNLGNYLGRSIKQDVFPLRICAQLSNTDTLTFAVAKGTDAMPPLGTAGRGATFALNASDVPESGATGTYVAHIPQGTWAIVDNITIDGQPAPSVDP